MLIASYLPLLAETEDKVNHRLSSLEDLIGTWLEQLVETSINDAHFLITVTSHLPPHHLPLALKVARQIHWHSWRARALAHVALRLSPPDRFVALIALFANHKVATI